MILRQPFKLKLEIDNMAIKFETCLIDIVGSQMWVSCTLWSLIDWEPKCDYPVPWEEPLLKRDYFYLKSVYLFFNLKKRIVSLAYLHWPSQRAVQYWSTEIRSRYSMTGNDYSSQVFWYVPFLRLDLLIKSLKCLHKLFQICHRCITMYLARVLQKQIRRTKWNFTVQVHA